MTDYKISDFKMFEAPYELPDSRGVIEAQIFAIKEQEKLLYGPAYTNRLIKYALQFESQRIGRNHPKILKP
ncbi:MAG: hypothetical protein ACETWM_08330 [Candidatus Lokiarchaeia archaeon]